MKNTSLKTGFCLLLVFLFSQMAIAQSAPLSAEAAPPAPVSPVTQIVIVTQEQSPPASSETSETRQTSTKKPVPTQQVYLNLPEPELPVINLDSTQQSQESSILPSTTEPNIDMDSLSAKVITPVLGNQFKIILVVFLGAIVGALLTLLIMYLIYSIRKRAE